MLFQLADLKSFKECGFEDMDVFLSMRIMITFFNEIQNELTFISLARHLEQRMSMNLGLDGIPASLVFVYFFAPSFYLILTKMPFDQGYFQQTKSDYFGLFQLLRRVSTTALSYSEYYSGGNINISHGN